MGTVNCRHHDNLQDGSGDSVQRFPAWQDDILTGIHDRFELFVLSEGEKKITEKVVSGKLAVAWVSASLAEV